MKIQRVNSGRLFGVLFALFGSFQGCRNADMDVTQTDRSNKIVSAPNPNPALYEGCYVENFHQPDRELIKKTDILLVVDSSSSLNAEREKIAREIKALVQEIPSSVDYQIAIMLAHGSRSKYSGRLWSFKAEPIVLKSREMSVGQISASLANSLSNVAVDGLSDGGEEGLFSLSRSLRPEVLAITRKQGFFRPETALAVIFVSDENDICFRYPSGLIPVPDPDNLELPAFNRDCANVTPESVLKQLQTHQNGLPLLVNGVIYTSNATRPVLGENEIGHGYSDIIALNKGIAVDLASESFHDGLKAVGELTTERLQLLTKFELSQKVDVDANTLKVFIDGNLTRAEYSTGFVQLLAELGNANSLIQVNYCVFRKDQ